MIKLFGRSKAQQRTIYLLIVILAVIAVAALLNAFNKQRELENQRLQALQQEQQLNQQIDTALSDLQAAKSDAEQGRGLKSLTHGRSGLQIATQEPGNAVVVDTVVLERPGFIVVYSGNGTPETILNSSSFLVRGVYPYVSIAIPTALKVGGSYYATIHYDGNDDGIFNNESDLPATGTNGEILAVQFAVARP